MNPPPAIIQTIPVVLPGRTIIPTMVVNGRLVPAHIAPTIVYPPKPSPMPAPVKPVHRPVTVNTSTRK